MKSRFKLSLVLCLGVAVFSSSASMAQNDTDAAQKLPGIGSFVYLPEMNDETRDFIAQVDRIEALKSGPQPYLSALFSQSPIYILPCRPRYWQNRLMPPPYYEYISAPQGICNF